MLNNKRGQFAVFNGLFIVLAIFVTLATLIVYTATYPTISVVIDTFLGSSTDPVINLMVRLFPMLFLFGIIMGFFFMIATREA